jgi:3-methyladenine DNA glycosylase AlkD
MNSIIADIRNDLISNADRKTKESGEKFFKEAVSLYGVRTAVTTSIGKEHFRRLTDTNKLTIFSYCDELWKSGKMEESFIACNWSYYVHKQYTPEDIIVFRDWINNYVTNWASCDTLCNHTVGTFIEMYPHFLKELMKWAKSENRWMRRASSVSLIVPARRGKFPEEIFKIADILLKDRDDMVQKGYGWMLKEASKVHQKEVYDFVIRNKKEMPRTAYRYAIEKMPPDLRKKAMEKDLPL